MPRRAARVEMAVQTRQGRVDRFTRSRDSTGCGYNQVFAIVVVEDLAIVHCLQAVDASLFGVCLMGWCWGDLSQLDLCEMLGLPVKG